MRFILLLLFTLQVDAQFSQRKKLEVQVDEEKRGKLSKEGKNKLTRSAIFTYEVEKKLIRGIDKTLAFYSKQYKRLGKGSNSRLNVMMRILDLNLEQAAYTRNEEERQYAEKWDSWDLGGRKGREPKINTSRSTKYWKTVIAQADRVMREYPKNREADRVIFTRAFAFTYLGREKQAAKLYTLLIQKYPNSKISGDAYSALGDYYFDRNDFRNASTNYKKALKYKRSKRYLWALYKLAWCYYNLGKIKSSLSHWKKVVSQSRAYGQQGAKLKEEALRDMVYAFAELKDVNGAIAYYRANGGEEFIGTLLLMLARELADAGNFKESIRTFKKFQRMFPNDPETPNAQKELVLLTYELGKLKALWSEIDTNVKKYGKQGSWANANKKDRAYVLETQKSVKEKTIYYPKIIHKRAQGSGSKVLHAHAKLGYATFLKHYPSSKETVEVKFNIADIEFFLKNYRAAGRQYLEITLRGPKKAVVYDPNSNKRRSIHKESAVYMVDSYARDFLPEFKKLQKAKTDFKKPPRKLSVRAKNYIKACATYLKYYPKDKKLGKTCETDLAKIYYQSNDKVKSRQYLFAIATKYPNSKDGVAAVEDLIPLYADDKVKLLDIANKLLKIPAYRKGRIGSKLRSLQQGAAKEAVAKEGDPLKRAKQYESLAKKNPSDPDADKLLYKASDNYLQAGAVASAIAAYAYLIKKYPSSKQTPNAILDMAQIFEKTMKLEQSAGYYQLFATKNRKDKRARGAFAKSCDLMIALDSRKSLKTCRAYLSTYSNDSEYVYSKLIRNAYRARRKSELNQLVRGLYLKLRLTANQKIIAYNMIGASKNIVSTFNANKKNVSGEALRYVGKIFFDDAQRSLSSYLKMGLVGGNVNKLQASIEKKGASLLSLKNKYDAVIRTGDSFWGAAALNQLGVIHEDLANKLSNPPSIAGAKKEDVVKQLQPQVIELKKQVIGYHQKGFEIVKKFNAYNSISSNNYNGLQRNKQSPLHFDDVVEAHEFYGTMLSESVAKEIGSVR